MILPKKKKKWDLKTHLQDHAYLFKLLQEVEPDDIHFTFSFEDIQFFNKNEAPEKILEELLKELLKEAEYKVKDGYYYTKKGEKRQKYCKRKIDLQELVKALAIHIKGSLGEHTHPHIHFILNKYGRYGKNFSLLRLHISKISAKYGLIPHFDEIKENRLKNLHDSVKKFFWMLKKKPSAEFKAYFFKSKNINLLGKMLDKLEQYTLATNNTLFYFKTMQSLQKRLKDNKINFEWHGHNIRKVIPIENILSKKDFEVIELINNKQFNQKDIKPYLKNPLLRDFARYSYYKDLNKSYIIKGLKETTLLKNPQPNSKLLNNFLKLYTKQNQEKKRKSQLTQQDNLALYFKNKVLEIAKKSINDKELKDNLLSEYNIKLSLKKRKGKVIGYTFIKDGTEHYFKQDEIIKYQELGQILKQNREYITNLADNLKKEREKEQIIYKKEKNENELQAIISTTQPSIERAIELKQAIEGEISRADTCKSEITGEIERADDEIRRCEQLEREASTGIGRFRKRFGELGERIQRGIRSIADAIRRVGRSIKEKFLNKVEISNTRQLFENNQANYYEILNYLEAINFLKYKEDFNTIKILVGDIEILDKNTTLKIKFNNLDMTNEEKLRSDINKILDLIQVTKTWKFKDLKVTGENEELNQIIREEIAKRGDGGEDIGIKIPIKIKIKY